MTHTGYKQQGLLAVVTEPDKGAGPISINDRGPDGPPRSIREGTVHSARGVGNDVEAESPLLGEGGSLE